MDKRKYNLKKGCTIFLAIYLICAFFFLYIARYQINYTRDEEVTIADVGGVNAGLLTDGSVIRQTVNIEHQYINGIKAYFSTYAKKNNGTVTVSVKDRQTEVVLAEKSVGLDTLNDNAWATIKFDKMLDVHEWVGKQLDVEFEFAMDDEESMVTMGIGNLLSEENLVEINGEKSEGNLCLTLLQTNDSTHRLLYPIALLILFVILLIVCVWLIWSDKHDKQNIGLKFLYVFRKYKFLMQQLVSRDFKTKYKRSVLGVFWSFLNPLLTMSVQYIVFSRIFRFQVENYPVFLLTGVVFYNGFSDATTQAMNAIVGNASLITKVYVPKYIYPISKVLSSSINILLSLIPLMIVALITGIRPSLALLLLFFGIACYILFIIGISFILSAAMTFFRDMQFLWGVLTMMWMYATPVIYPIETLEGTFLLGFQKINPMYHYITFFRTIIISGTSPEPMEYVLCIGFAAIALLVGGLIFKKTQDQFVLHI